MLDSNAIRCFYLKPKDKPYSMANMSDYKQIRAFTTHLRTIPGLYLFRIFSKYTSLIDIDPIFNTLAKCESEEDLRELERMWNEFIKKDKLE